MARKIINQSGAINILPIMLVIIAVGMIGYLLISSTLPLNSGLFGILFPKPGSQAAVSGPVSGPVTPIYDQRIDSGGTSNYIDRDGHTWLADQAYTSGGFGYIGGSNYVGDRVLNSIADPTLYQTTRYGNAFEYRFTVPNGTYTVNLKLAEVRNLSCQTAARVFDVISEDIKVISSNDTFARVGCGNNGDRSFTVDVNDGILNVFLGATNGGASLNGIEVVSANGVPSTPIPSTQPSAFIRRVDLGSGVGSVDSTGVIWDADHVYTAGTTNGYGYTNGSAYSSNIAIAGTNDDTLYQTTTFANSFDYTFDVPVGNYQVTLKLAEIRQASCIPGGRAFRVSAEGNVVIASNDTFSQVGCATAGDQTFNVAVNDGHLNLNFTSVAGGPAAVNGIQIRQLTN